MMAMITNKKIPLKHPFTDGLGNQVTEITLRLPTRGDMRQAHKHSSDQVDQEAFLFSRLTELKEEDLDLLSLADWKQLTETFQKLSE